MHYLQTLQQNFAFLFLTVARQGSWHMCEIHSWIKPLQCRLLWEHLYSLTLQFNISVICQTTIKTLCFHRLWCKICDLYCGTYIYTNIVASPFELSHYIRCATMKTRWRKPVRWVVLRIRDFYLTWVYTHLLTSSQNFWRLYFGSQKKEKSRKQPKNQQFFKVFE
jgi:hypothetical protein